MDGAEDVVCWIVVGAVLLVGVLSVIRAREALDIEDRILDDGVDYFAVRGARDRKAMGGS